MGDGLSSYPMSIHDHLSFISLRKKAWWKNCSIDIGWMIHTGFLRVWNRREENTVPQNIPRPLSGCLQLAKAPHLQASEHPPWRGTSPSKSSHVPSVWCTPRGPGHCGGTAPAATPSAPAYASNGAPWRDHGSCGTGVEPVVLELGMVGDHEEKHQFPIVLASVCNAKTIPEFRCFRARYFCCIIDSLKPEVH